MTLYSHNCISFHAKFVKFVFSQLNSDQAISNRSSVFAEAILLPWDLTFTEKDEVANLTTPEDQQRNSIKYSSIDKFKEDLRIKKCKADQTSNKALDSGKCDAGSLIYRLSNSKSYSDEEHSELHSQIKFPCLVSGRSFKVPHQGFLHCTDGEAMTSSGCKLDERQVFLEFGSDSFHMYEVCGIFFEYLFISIGYRNILVLEYP